MDIDTEGFEYRDLLIDTEDGNPITIGEFAAQVHDFLNEFKRHILAVKWFCMYGTTHDARLARIGVSKEDLKVYFDHVTSNDFEDELWFFLVTKAEDELKHIVDLYRE